MPKDRKKNVDRFKVRGGDINEFEYDQNQEAFAGPKTSAATNLIPGTPPEEKQRPIVAAKAAKKKAAVSTRGASAKKLAARKAAKKK